MITNGTAILGLGNRGAMASKPVMEGKAVLFKRFADVDSIDIEVTTEDPEEFINSQFIGPRCGGINLEDIKAPECFIIESAARTARHSGVPRRPAWHRDHRGGRLINAMHLTGRDSGHQVVVNGAGAAGIACVELSSDRRAPDNVILCDPEGVIYKGRQKA